MFNLRVRVATPWDKEAASRIQEQVLPPSHPYQYWKNIGDQRILNLVAERDGQIIGFASTLLAAWNPAGADLWERLVPYIGFIGVSLEHQRSGVGRALLEEVITQLRAAGFNGGLYAECKDTNLEFFGGSGFWKWSSKEVEHLYGIRPWGNVIRFDL